MSPPFQSNPSDQATAPPEAGPHATELFKSENEQRDGRYTWDFTSTLSEGQEIIAVDIEELQCAKTVLCGIPGKKITIDVSTSSGQDLQLKLRFSTNHEGPVALEVPESHGLEDTRPLRKVEAGACTSWYECRDRAAEEGGRLPTTAELAAAKVERRERPVRARPGRVERPSRLVLHRESLSYGAFVRARRVRSSPNHRFMARAVVDADHPEPGRPRDRPVRLAMGGTCHYFRRPSLQMYTSYFDETQ